ncbi:hypothetical protein BP00DRAFT_446803 [Aspergillus indologenus CBS 114.80]|uniref:Uncharacterized protein n=1 Tax=Aspergillus indologenus CBS 114.80 TaxID=1450541 RepID=A0A2V5I7U5_9EURO|nr:hypothetical protein BP00DRAFT_446803 [Aspergillus indologenus CBS 114.80]
MTATSEPRDEYNLQEAWERVCRSFAQTIKADLTTAPKYTIEETVIDKTLAFVKLLGGIVAQGASMIEHRKDPNRLDHQESPEPKQTHSLASTLITYGRYDDALEQLKLASSLMSEN